MDEKFYGSFLNLEEQKKQGGRNEKKTQTLAKKSQNLSDSRWLQTLKQRQLPGFEFEDYPYDDSVCNGLCETCTMLCR